ncbi:Coiled-coil domain-containing protein 55 (DUF2040) [Fragilaria crotonensis]|nr:Coiled-coil domain-containing protein 55 (DUF2040) [Fragilaria crotonensis]
MMNISLLSAAEKQKQKKAKLSFGLNTTSASVKKSNVFGDDEDEDEDDNDQDETGRDQVNRDLLREQEALRRRASSALDSYDFDGTYEATSKAGSDAPKSPKRESRYISDMMKKAAKRNYERDMALERKLAKEQAAEEADFLGKEKFITAAYKKKLAERELWKQEEEEQSRRDEQVDVTKRKDGLVGFYSNLSKNASMGGKEEVMKDDDKQDSGETSRPSFLDGFAPAGETDDAEAHTATSKPSFLDGFEASSANADDNELENETTPTMSLYQRRAEKLAKARFRYFQRRGISEQEALQERY